MKRMKKRIVTTGVIGMATLLGFAGCRPGGTKGSQVPPPDTTAQAKIPVATVMMNFPKGESLQVFFSEGYLVLGAGLRFEGTPAGDEWDMRLGTFIQVVPGGPALLSLRVAEDPTGKMPNRSLFLLTLELAPPEGGQEQVLKKNTFKGILYHFKNVNDGMFRQARKGEGKVRFTEVKEDTVKGELALSFSGKQAEMFSTKKSEAFEASAKGTFAVPRQTLEQVLTAQQGLQEEALRRSQERPVSGLP